jgi:hypothetical protein
VSVVGAGALANALATVVAALLRELLGFLAGRADLKAAVTARLVARDDKRALAALRWLADATNRPDAGATLPIKENADAVPPEGGRDVPS